MVYLPALAGRQVTDSRAGTRDCMLVEGYETREVPLMAVLVPCELPPELPTAMPVLWIF